MKTEITEGTGSTVASLEGFTPEEIVVFIVAQAAAAKAAYSRAANALVALIDKVGEAKAKSMLRKAGWKDTDLKNGMQLVRVYDAVVRPGFADQDWFNDVLFLNAVDLNRALTKVGVEDLVSHKLLDGKAGSWVEISLVADTGMFKAERIEKADKQAEREAEKAKKDAAKGGEGEGDEGGDSDKEKTPRDEFDSAVEKLEAITVALVATSDEVTIEAIRQRLTALGTAFESAVKANVKKSKKQAVAS
jgi:hypothetical protein